MHSKLSLIRVKKLTSWLEFNNRYKIGFIFAKLANSHYIHVNNVGFFWKKMTLYGGENRASSQNEMRNYKAKIQTQHKWFSIVDALNNSKLVLKSWFQNLISFLRFFFIELNNIILENCHPFEIVLTVSSLTRLWHHSSAGITNLCLSKIGYILHNFKVWIISNRLS